MTKSPLFESSSLNASLIDEMYEKYIENPQTVEASWQLFFAKMEEISGEKTADLISPNKQEGDPRVLTLINAYRTSGHLLANLNPLSTFPPQFPAVLMLANAGLSEEELPKYFFSFGLLPEIESSLEEILKRLKEIYCGNIGFEYRGLHDLQQEAWIRSRIEVPHAFKSLSLDQKQLILQHLNKSELFESFIHTKYVGQKRFSLEGAETLIPMLEAALEKGAELGVDEWVIGMAHRGRLNVLSNLLKKSYEEIFSEFEEGYLTDSFEGSGDVKYHKGYYSEILRINHQSIKVTLPPNPSHLESIDPVVEGQVRAKQDQRQDKKREKVVPLLIHGDAAVSGQGVVYETLQFYNLPGYSTGGTLHIVINNQIGFTTLPSESRSTVYCTDIARAFNAPVFHVNAEDPEACIYALQLALEIRQRFHSDVFIDLVCYRKYGHNEGDEPAFTQPLDYQLIRKKKPIREMYRDQLIAQGVLEKKIAEALEEDFKKKLHEAHHVVKNSLRSPGSPARSEKEVKKDHEASVNSMVNSMETAVSKMTLQEIGKSYGRLPEGFTPHPKLKTLLKDRLNMVEREEESKGVDWGMAEILAYGSLLWEGHSIRLAGQDSGRGTFSHRHALWVDQATQRSYCPLQFLKADQGSFTVFNSSLSEYAVLGFEFGYSVAAPQTLVIWEAQFGDFCNGAQIVIDQYIATAEQKWGHTCGLVLYLPHGYEGQGPEHSSARIERFLTLCGNNNMRVVNPTSPAQFFHLIRRQALSPVKKPLIVFTPKGLLRLPACTSPLKEFSSESFQEVLEDPEVTHRQEKEIKQLIFCSGRLYYDLTVAREGAQNKETAIIRLEQLYPLHLEKLRKIIGKYSQVEKYFWAQEEPCNMGAWEFIRPLLSPLLPLPLHYVGRPRSASPAVGSHALHRQQHAAILDVLFGINKKSIQNISEVINSAQQFNA